MASNLVRRWSLVAAAVAAILAVLTAAAHLPFVRVRVFEWARTRIAQDYGILVQAGSFSYNLLTTSLELHQPTLTAAEGEPPFLSAEAARIVLNRSVLWGVVEVDRLELARPRLAVVRHRDGSTNLPATRGQPSTEPSPFYLGVVSLSQMSLELEDEASGQRASVGPLDLTLDTRAAGSRPGDFGPSPFSVSLGAREERLAPRSIVGTVAGQLSFGGVRLDVAELRIDAMEGRLALDGWVDVAAATPSVQARAKLDVNLAEIGDLLGAPSGALAGSASTQLTVSGLLADPVVKALVSGSALQYQSVVVSSLTADATYRAGRLEVERLDVASSVGAAEVSGSLSFAESAGTPDSGRALARISGVDVDRLLDAVGIAAPVRLGSGAAGEIEASVGGVALASADWLQRLESRASVRFTSSGSGLSLAGRADLRLRGGRWTVDHALESPSARAATAGVVSGQLARRSDQGLDSTLTGRSNVRFEELGAVALVLRQAGVDVPPLLENEISGSVDARVEPLGTIRSPRVGATVGGRAIRLRELAGGELDSTVVIDRVGARVESLEARLDRTRLVASGLVSWAGRIDARFEGVSDDVARLARAVGTPDVSLAGSARLTGSLQGDVRSPRVLADLAARDLAAYDVAIGRVEGVVGFSDQRLRVDARAPDLRVQLLGGLDASEPFRYQVEGTLDRSSIGALLPASLRSQARIDGVITATVRGQGTLRSPYESIGDVALRSLELDVSGVPIALQDPATFVVDRDSIRASPTRLRVGRETELRLQGALAHTDAREGLDLRVDGPLPEILEVAGPLLPDWPLQADAAQATLDLHVGGTIRAPQPAGTMTVRAASLRYADNPPLTDVALDAGIESTRIALRSLAARWQGATLAAAGVLPLRMMAPEPAPAGAAGMAAWGSDWLASLSSEPSSATLTARLTDVTEEALAPFVEPSRLGEITGTLAASVTAEADAFALDEVRASIVVDRGSLTVANVPFTQAVPTRLRLLNGYAQIEDLRWEAQGNEVRVSGGARVTGPTPTLDLAVRGALDLRVLGAFASGFASGGLARPDLTVKGSVSAPEILGSVEVTAGEVQIEAPPIAASGFEGTIAVAPGRRATISLEGLVNGGSAVLAGEVSFEELAAPSGLVTLTARNLMLDYPEGLQTESNADLKLVLAPAGSTLSGRVEVAAGTYREPLIVSRRLLASFGPDAVGITAAPSSFLTTLGLDVTVATSNEIRVDNNYGRLSLTANLRVTGTADRPGVLGRIEALPDGEIYLAGNTYRIQNLVVDLTSSQAISPDVRFLAETRVGSVPIEVELSCVAAGPCERNVRSQAAGVTSEQAEALLFGIPTDPAAAGTELARLLSGEVLGIVGRAVGLDTLRLEQGAGGRTDLFDDPTLVAGDVNPASRLTFGKRVGERVELAYSQNLAESGFTTNTSYFAPAGISLRALLLDEGSRYYEFRHEPRIGGRRRRRAAREPGATIAAVRFLGSPGFSDAELRGQLRLTEGDRFAFRAWQADRERLNSVYLSRGFFEARVRARRLPAAPEEVAAAAGVPGAEAIVLEYTIERGRPTKLEVAGFDIPDALRRQIVERWNGAVFDAFLERDVTLIVRQHLFRVGRLQAGVATAMRREEADGVRTLRVEIDPGPVMRPRLEFEGNALITTPTLLRVAERLDPLSAWLDPTSFAAVVERLYQQEGLLSTDADVSAPEVAGDVSLVRVVVREGERRPTVVAPARAETAPVDRPVVVQADDRERPRYTFRYGVGLSDETAGPDERDQHIGLAADFENRNGLGLGQTVGVSARLRRDQQVGRVFVGADRLFALPVRSALFVSRSREQIGSDGGFDTTSEVTELSAEQTYRLRRLLDVRWGYGLGRNRTTFAGSDFDLTVMVARLTSGGSMDRRDDPFNPMRGWFASANLELSRPGLGSDLSFLRSYSQYLRFTPLRNGIVVAVAARLGLARTFRGETLIPSERFFGGGATSVRGYREGDLGPRSIFGDADGGSALVVLNGEVRFPIRRSVRGVGFLDLGNVYGAVSDVALSNVQVSVGAGVRLDTPIGLFRLDLGVPTNPRDFDKPWLIHFGLGHAF